MAGKRTRAHARPAGSAKTRAKASPGRAPKPVRLDDEDDLRLKLPPRKIAFAHAYAACHNATEAARLAGYKGEYLAQRGHHLRRDPDVARLIADLVEDELAKQGVRIDRVLEELASMGFAEVGPADEVGRRKDLSDGSELLVVTPAAKAAALSGNGRAAR